MIRTTVLPDGQIVAKEVVADLSILDSAIVHHHDSMYLDENQKARVSWVVKMTTGKSVIEIGTATGYVISRIEALYRVGVDNNIARLLLAKMRYPEIDFYYGNIFNLSPFYGQGFDCLIATEIFEHLPYNTVQFAAHHCLMTAPKLIVTLPQGADVMKNPEHLWEPTIDKFQDRLSCNGVCSNEITHIEYGHGFMLMVIERKDHA